MAPTVADRRAPGSIGPLALYGLPGPQLHEASACSASTSSRAQRSSLLTSLAASPKASSHRASRRFGYWSGPRGVAQARPHRLRLRRHPAAQPRCAAPAHLTPGLCRRSPPADDRWHIRQPVAAARFTAVLPRGAGGDTGGARRHRSGMGTQRKDRCSGVRRPREWSPGTGGSGLPLEVPARGRVRPPPRPVGISVEARSVTAGAGLAFWVPGTLISRLYPNQHLARPTRPPPASRAFILDQLRVTGPRPRGRGEDARGRGRDQAVGAARSQGRSPARLVAR
jgi:hypothetical protein